MQQDSQITCNKTHLLISSQLTSKIFDITDYWEKDKFWASCFLLKNSRSQVDNNIKKMYRIFTNRISSSSKIYVQVDFCMSHALVLVKKGPNGIPEVLNLPYTMTF